MHSLLLCRVCVSIRRCRCRELLYPRQRQGQVIADRLMAAAPRKKRERTMKITGIEATAISVPVKASFWTSLQAMGGGKAVSELIVKVHTDDGLVGLGEGHGGPPLAAAKL